MRLRLITVVWVAMTFVVIGRNANTADGPVPSAAASVRRALDGFFQAAEKRDWTSIRDFLAPDFEFFTDDAIILDRAGFLRAMQEDSMEIRKFALSDVKVELSPDERLAWIKYRVHLESSIRGKEYNVVTAETVVFRKDGAKWRMTHNHASIKKIS